MQVIGFCRFSYPAEGGFQVEHPTIEDRIAYLYSQDRLEERFRHFEGICLPSLLNQTDPDFTFVILVGDQLPDAYRERLESLVVGLKDVRIVARPPQPHRKVCQQVLNEARTDIKAPCLQFRHDDDDAIALDFVATLKQAAQDCLALIRTHGLVGFDWNRGYVARPDAKGICAEEVVHPYWGVAQAVAVQGKVRRSIMNFGHQKLNQFMPTVTFTDRPMYVRGHNDHNDSRQGKHVKPVTLPRLSPDQEQDFRDLFAIDADAIRRLFA